MLVGGAADGPLLAALESVVSGGVSARASARLSFAHDASHYLLTPRAVITPRSAAEVAALLRMSSERGLPITFRSGGTSLSGQATTDGLLVDTRRHFRSVEVLADGDRVRTQPGATVRAVNTRLAVHGRKLGPDPASESACTIGGVVANNSSGMACGVALNTYHTLESAVLVLPSGTVLDTGAADADERLLATEPDLHAGLARLRERVRGNPTSVAEVRRLYAIKNTMGYCLNAFVDHARPVDVLTRLVVGSEGTLAFLAEATFRTVSAHPHAATGLLVFADLAGATAALPDLVAAGFATIELLDAASLRVAQRDPRAGADLRALDVRSHAALLVEYQEPTAEELTARLAAGDAAIARLPLTGPAALGTDPDMRARLWHIRKGLYAAVAGARPAGTTALLEDVAVPVERLLPTCRALTNLFGAHGYRESVIFGHAKDGNIHFMLNEQFDRPEMIDRYLAFTDEMVDVVLAEGGTLKAEHGTGRIMAPYVRRQFGDELYDVMCEVKRLVDPRGVMNPGVLLNEDRASIVAHLKTAPRVEEEVDRCVECGFCEPVCPSRDLTTTPRRRIVLRREMARAREAGDVDLLRSLEADFGYDAIDTCAADGMCQTACPVLIDTGDLVRRLRSEGRGRAESAAWTHAARHWDGATRAASAALTGARALPAPVAERLTRAASTVTRAALPRWSRDLPGGGARRRSRQEPAARAVFFPSCTSTMFGAAGVGVGEAFERLCARADVAVRAPEGIASLCCGTPWKSKGLTRGHVAMRDRVLPALWRATERGVLPVVVDATSCTEGLQEMIAGAGALPEPLTVLDAVEFVAEHVLRWLDVEARLPSLALHPTCSSTRIGLNDALMRVAAAVADEVVVPEGWGCCGFAGDRGLLRPELTAAATAAEAASVGQRSFAAYASTNRTCELGMTRATGRPYRHILEILEEVTRPSATAR